MDGRAADVVATDPEKAKGLEFHTCDRARGRGRLQFVDGCLCKNHHIFVFVQEVPLGANAWDIIMLVT